MFITTLYHNVLVGVRSNILHVVGMSNLTLYFVYRGGLFIHCTMCPETGDSG